MRPTAIQQAAAAYFGVTVAQLCNGKLRSTSIVTARHCARYLEHREGRSLGEIAEVYACDHTTALTSVNHMRERVAAGDPRYAPAVAAIAEAVARGRASAASAAAAGGASAADALACPTCGAPVIRELQRRVAELAARVAELVKERT